MQNLFIVALFTLALLVACKSLPPAGSYLEPTDFGKQLEKKNTVLLDVRTQAEYDSAHIPGALLVDFKAPGFEEKISRLNKKDRYLLYCKSGARSDKASQLMLGDGFKHVYQLKNGIYGYKDSLVKKDQ